MLKKSLLSTVLFAMLVCFCTFSRFVRGYWVCDNRGVLG